LGGTQFVFTSDEAISRISLTIKTTMRIFHTSKWCVKT